MLHHPTEEKLRQLKLNGMLQALNEREKNNGLSFEEQLGLLVDREILVRDNRRLAARLHQARLQGACMADIDYRKSRGLDKSLLQSLQSSHWIQDPTNILITGPCGAGKTFLGRALGHQACLLGYRALWLRLPRLFEELFIAQADGSLIKFFQSLKRIDVLILDDFGLDAFTDQQRRIFLEIIEDRHELRCTIMTSQVPVDQWHQLIGHTTLADAILDRIVHNAYKIELDGGDSMRKIKAFKKNLV
jgi:DNA replication protein DnaC